MLEIRKKIATVVVGVVVLALFFSLPWSRKWLAVNILCPDCSIFVQARGLEVEQRMSVRFGTSYNAFMAMRKSLLSINAKDPTILIPPRDYVRAMAVKGDPEMPEPAVFYYFTGIRSVSLRSPGLYQANWVLVAENHQLFLRKIRSKPHLDSLITIFQDYL
jgi:hypothetical protein